MENLDVHRFNMIGRNFYLETQYLANTAPFLVPSYHILLEITFFECYDTGKKDVPDA
jgi:hypothetical protein